MCPMSADASSPTRLPAELPQAACTLIAYCCMSRWRHAWTAVLKSCVLELSAGGDFELGEDLAQVILDRCWVARRSELAAKDIASDKSERLST